MNVGVTSIAPACLLLGGVLQLLTGLLQVGLFLFRCPLSLGIRVPYRLPGCPFGLALGCLGGVPGLVTLAHLNILLSRGALLGTSGDSGRLPRTAALKPTRKPGQCWHACRQGSSVALEWHINGDGATGDGCGLSDHRHWYQAW